MTDPTNVPLLPSFMEAGWAGSGASYVCRRFPADTDSDYAPWLALGTEHAHTYEYLTQAALEAANLTQESAEAQAITNLTARTPEWQTQVVEVNPGEMMRFLVSTGDYFAAEQLLNVDYMKAAQAKLRVSSLTVGIPRRGFLFATNGSQPEHLQRAFATAVIAQFHGAQSPPITPLVFSVTDGVVTDVLNPDETYGIDAVPRDDAIFVSATIVNDDATDMQTLLVRVGGADLHQLHATIEEAYKKLLAQHLGNPTFSGSVIFEIVPDLTPDSAELRRLMDALAPHLAQVVNDAGIRTLNGGMINVSMRYGGAVG